MGGSADFGEAFQMLVESREPFDMWLPSARARTGSPYLVKDINPGGISFPSHLIKVGGTFFFTADDGTNGQEL